MKIKTYSPTSVGGVRATLATLASLVSGRSMELSATFGLGEPGWRNKSVLALFFILKLKDVCPHLWVVDVDVDGILEGEVVGQAVVREGGDFDFRVVEGGERQLRAVRREPHGLVAAQNLLCNSKNNIKLKISPRHSIIY